jgi:hypothetical protein
MPQIPVRPGINESDHKPGEMKHTKFNQPDEDVKTNDECTSDMKLPLTVVLLALASTTADTVVHIFVANLVEKRVYKEHAGDDAEPQVIPHHRVIQRDKTLTFLDGSNEPDYPISLDPQGVREITNPKREIMARTVYDKDVITTDISWFLVRCACSIQKGELNMILKDMLPRTSVRSGMPSDTGDDGTTSEAQHAHDEDAEAHWDAATEFS